MTETAFEREVSFFTLDVREDWKSSPNSVSLVEGDPNLPHYGSILSNILVRSEAFSIMHRVHCHSANTSDLGTIMFGSSSSPPSIRCCLVEMRGQMEARTADWILAYSVSCSLAGISPQETDIFVHLGWSMGIQIWSGVLFKSSLMLLFWRQHFMC